MDQLRRFHALLTSLAKHRFPTSLDRLAEEHEAPAPTLSADLAALAQLGAPIEGDDSLGYMLIPGLISPPVMFSEAEIAALQHATSLVLDHPDHALAARTALAKLDAAAPLAHIGPLSARPKRSIEPLRQLALRAIRDERALRITYRDGDAMPTQRAILPLQLAQLQSAHIIAAWCCLRLDFRHFRLDRILKAELTDQPFHQPRAELARRWFDALEADEPDIAAALHRPQDNIFS